MMDNYSNDNYGDDRQCHEKNDPMCFICNLHFSSNYLLIHLKVDHTKEELALHLCLVFIDAWAEEQQQIAEELLSRTPQ